MPSAPSPAAALQWGRRRTSTETRRWRLRWPPVTRFNGAADERRRRHPLRRSEREASDASMGPPTNVDGDDTLLWLTDEDASVLQWGRRRTSTETGSLPVRRPVSSALQWGRRRTSTETERELGVSLDESKLQWGRRRTSTETSSSNASRCSSAKLQWGRRRTSTETSRRRGRSARPCSFNGAADERRRRQSVADDAKIVLNEASMGPPTNVDGDSTGHFSNNIAILNGSLRAVPRMTCGHDLMLVMCGRKACDFRKLDVSSGDLTLRCT